MKQDKKVRKSNNFNLIGAVDKLTYVYLYTLTQIQKILVQKYVQIKIQKENLNMNTEI